MSQSRGVVKRFLSQIRISTDPIPIPIPAPSSLSLRRGVQSSVYDKNVDEQVRPTMVPEEAITKDQPEKYWGPHPKTGVFGPIDEQDSNDAAAANASKESVLEEKTFFRPLEDLDKPENP